MKKILYIVITLVFVFLLSHSGLDVSKHSLNDSAGIISFAHAKKGDKKDGKDKRRDDKKKREDKKKKGDKDRGPSVPAIPMAAAALLGLGGISAAAYFLKKKKKQ